MLEQQSAPLHTRHPFRIRIYRDIMLDSTVVCRRALGCEWGGTTAVCRREALGCEWGGTTADDRTRESIQRTKTYDTRVECNTGGQYRRAIQRTKTTTRESSLKSHHERGARRRLEDCVSAEAPRRRAPFRWQTELDRARPQRSTPPHHQGSAHLPGRGSVVTVTQLGPPPTYLSRAPGRHPFK